MSPPTRDLKEENTERIRGKMERSKDSQAKKIEGCGKEAKTEYFILKMERTVPCKYQFSPINKHEFQVSRKKKVIMFNPLTPFNLRCPGTCPERPFSMTTKITTYSQLFSVMP